MGKRSKGWEEAAEQFKRAIERLSKRGFDIDCSGISFGRLFGAPLVHKTLQMG